MAGVDTFEDIRASGNVGVRVGVSTRVTGLGRCRAVGGGWHLQKVRTMLAFLKFMNNQ